jgi:hypothetical protein
MHLIYPIFLVVILLILVAPILVVVGVGVLRGRSGQPVQTGVLVSPDGNWWWDGQKWVSALSEDGRWRWNGREWQPTPHQTGL